MVLAVAALIVTQVILWPYVSEGKGPGLLALMLDGHKGIEWMNQKPDVASVMSMPFAWAYDDEAADFSGGSSL